MYCSVRWCEVNGLPTTDADVCDASRPRPVEGSDVFVSDFARVRAENPAIKIVDVRSPAQFAICSLAGSVNVPLSELEHGGGRAATWLETHAKAPSEPVYVVCRRGIASVEATNVSITPHTRKYDHPDLIHGMMCCSCCENAVL